MFILRCGSGTQIRRREITEPPNCGTKWAEFEFGPFECPFPGMEERTCNVGCENGGEPVPVGGNSSDATCRCLGRWGGTCCNRGRVSKYQTVINLVLHVSQKSTTVESVAFSLQILHVNQLFFLS